MLKYTINWSDKMSKNININEKKKIEGWLKRIRLAKYKSLYSSGMSDVERELIDVIKKNLLADGFTEEQLQLELENYEQNELPNKDAIIKIKVDEIIYDIAAKLEKKGQTTPISTDIYPEYYYRIQEVIAMDSVIGAQLLQEAEEKANIEHVIFNNTDFYGNNLGGNTYYFSKKLQLKKDNMFK